MKTRTHLDAIVGHGGKATLETVDGRPEMLLQLEDRRAKVDQLIAETSRLWHALRESVKLQAHYANLLNMHDGGERIVFKNAEEWIERLK